MCDAHSESFEFADGGKLSRFRGWLLHTEDVKVAQQEQTDYGCSVAINVRVFRVDGARIELCDLQEGVETRSAWGISVVEYRSDGKFDYRPTGLKREFELSIKLHPNRGALIEWCSRAGLRLDLKALGRL